MKRKRGTIIITILVVIIGGSFLYSYNEKNSVYKEDAEFLLNFLEDNYPYFQVKERMYGYDFLEHKDAYIKEIARSKDDVEFLKNVDGVMNRLQNGHSHVYTATDPGKGITENEVLEKIDYWGEVRIENTCIPDVKWKYVEGSYIIISSKNKDIPVGSIISEINGKRIDDYVYDNLEKFYWNHKDYKNDVFFNDYYLKYDDDSVEVKFSYEGIEKKSNINFSRANDSLIQWYKGEDYIKDNDATLDIVEDDNTAYIGIKSFQTNYMDADIKNIKEFLINHKSVDNIIIDIRGNTGGNNLYGYSILSNLINDDVLIEKHQCIKDTEYMKTQPFKQMLDREVSIDKIPNKDYNLEKFKVYQKLYTLKKDNDSIEYKGNIYVLVDSYVFSASEYFIDLVKELKIATIIGTNTGGDGTGFQPIVEYLPNSKLGIRMSPAITFNQDGSVNEETHTKPDIYIEQGLKEYEEYLKSELGDIRRSEYDNVYMKTLDIIRKIEN
ncbi:MAG: S41 family peptidase [Clostridium sp.]